MTKKIPVYTSGHAAPLDLSLRPLYKWPVPATLVVHSGMAHEPVYTESEVKALLKELAEYQWFSNAQLEFLKGKGFVLDEG